MADAGSGKRAIIRSELSEEGLRPFLETYVESLPEQVKGLSELVADRDLKALRHRVHNLRGSGGLYGLMAISEVAGEVEMLIHTEASVVEISEKVRELIDILERVEGYGEKRSQADCHGSAALTTA